jgi:hypothetical protein
MEQVGTPRGLDAVRYRDGQLLRARDLADDQRAETQLRWWHTVALHNVWGIVSGLVVDERLRVSPGLAYDCLGRELLLAEPAHPGLPPGELPGAEHKPWVLVARYGSAVPPAFAGGVCIGAGTEREPERLALAWRSPGQVELGLEVPLAEVRVSDAVDVYPRVRRYALPAWRPRTYAGRTPADAEWRPWLTAVEPPIGWSIEVSTAHADFPCVPHYFARLAGGPSGLHFPAPWVGPFTFMSKPRRDGFTYVFYYASTDTDADREKLDSVFEDGVPTVTWLGVVPACPETRSDARDAETG